MARQYKNARKAQKLMANYVQAFGIKMLYS